jgi:aryl-alcohol dehydrogenase-like predicted oxidoreductase
MGQGKSSGEVPRRMLGRTGVEVSALALGGSHLGETKSKREALRIVREAISWTTRGNITTG